MKSCYLKPTLQLVSVGGETDVLDTLHSCSAFPPKNEVGNGVQYAKPTGYDYDFYEDLDEEDENLSFSHSFSR